MSANPCGPGGPTAWLFPLLALHPWAYHILYVNRARTRSSDPVMSPYPRKGATGENVQEGEGVGTDVCYPGKFLSFLPPTWVQG